MQKTVHYSVEIDCAPCPEGYAAQIARQLQTAFPVTVCQHTPNGLAMRLTSAHPFADGALKDFADLVGETLTGLGIRMTCGVVRAGCASGRGVAAPVARHRGRRRRRAGGPPDRGSAGPGKCRCCTSTRGCALTGSCPRGCGTHPGAIRPRPVSSKERKG